MNYKKRQKVILKNGLDIPSYKRNFYSVQTATEKGALINLSQNYARLIALDGKVFDIKKDKGFSFLDNKETERRSARSQKNWQEIFTVLKSSEIGKDKKQKSQKEVSSSEKKRRNKALNKRLSQSDFQRRQKEENEQRRVEKPQFEFQF